MNLSYIITSKMDFMDVFPVQPYRFQDAMSTFDIW